MNFSRPDLLILAAGLPVVVALLVAGYAARRRRAAETLGEAPLLARLGAPDLTSFPTRRLVMLAVAAAALGVAAAGPQWGTREIESRTESLNLVLVLDVSRSMLVDDVAPNRLETMRIFARRLVRELRGDRIGLVIFAGRAYVLTPMTTDASALELFLDALDPGMVSQGGSALSAGIVQGTDLVRAREELAGDRVVLVVSDGEALEEQSAVRQAADRARRAGVTVHTVGIGTPAGGFVPDHDAESGEQIGFKRWQGELVVSRLEESVLRDAADRTGGRYVHLTGLGAAGTVIAELRAMQREAATQRRVEGADRYAWFAVLALLLIVADALMARPSRAAHATPRGVRTAARSTLLLLLVVVVSGAAIGDLERGNRHYRAGRYAEAVDAYEAALRNGRGSAELHYNLGTALLALRRYAEAEPHLRRALETVEPELRQRAYYNLGNRYLEAARSSGSDVDAATMLDAAEEAYRHALRLDPSDVHAKWNLEMTLRDREADPPQTPPESSRDPQQEDEDAEPEAGDSPGSGGGQGSPAMPDRSPAGGGELSQQEAERILNAAEQDELQVTRNRLRMGQPRRTPVGRDW